MRREIPRLLVLRLGLRLLLVRDVRRLVSMMLVMVGIAVATLGILCGAAAYRAADSRTDRNAARAFAMAGDTQDPKAWIDIEGMRYGLVKVTRVDIALSDNPPEPPPGLSSWPRSGELIVSPQYRRLGNSDPVLRSYVPGRIVGLIGQSGLRSPDELLVYRGVSRNTILRGGIEVVSANGSSPGQEFAISSEDLSTGQRLGLLAIFDILLGLPVVVFIIVATRLSARTRSRRLATLHFLGMPAKKLRRINAIEIVMVSALGIALALGLYPLLNRILASSRLLGIVWFPGDTALDWNICVLVIMTVGALGAIAARLVDPGAGLASIRARMPATRRASSMWRCLPLVFGLTSLIAQVLVGARQVSNGGYVRNDNLMLTAIFVTGVGLFLAIAPLTRWIGNQAHRHGGSLAVRLGGARAGFDPASSARLVAGLAVFVFAVGVSIGQTRDARAVTDPVGDVLDVQVGGQDLPLSAARNLLQRDHLSELIQFISMSDEPPRDLTNPPPSVMMIAAHCADLADAVGRTTINSCKAGIIYWSNEIPAEQRTLTDVALRPDLTPTTSRTAPDSWIRSLEVDAVVTIPDRVNIADIWTSPKPTRAGEVVYSDAVTLIFRVARADADATLAQIYAVAPYSQPSVFGVDPDSRENIAMINGWIRLGMVAGFVMTLLTLATALADRARERSRADHELLAAGVPARLLRRVHGWEIALAVTGPLLSAVAGGALGGFAWQLAGGLNTAPDWGSITGLALLSILAVGLVVAVAVAAAPRRLDPGVLRSD